MQDQAQQVRELRQKVKQLEQPPTVATSNFSNIPSATPKPTPDENDCILIATNKYRDLHAAWKKILTFHYVVNGKPLEDLGHAVVVWKITDDGDVWFYDKVTSSVNLHITSTDENEVLRALGAVYSKVTQQQVTLTGDYAK